jgi:hypothetical protein
MGLRYHRGDERPAWVGTVEVNGTTDDMSSGYSFTVKVAASLSDTAVLTKTTGITGATGGVFTCAWAVNDLDITPGEYIATCRIRRTADSFDETVTEPLTILAYPS